jgi:hypothetical protein
MLQAIEGLIEPAH